VVEVVKRLEKRKTDIPVGLSIGKGYDTPLEEAWRDYMECARHSAPCVDFIELNISSPNTPSLVSLHNPEFLEKIMGEVLNVIEKVSPKTGLFVKISPDISVSQLEKCVDVLTRYPVDAIVVCNTTRRRYFFNVREEGGVSGALLRPYALAIHSHIARLNIRIPVIASGGIMSPHDALWRKKAGCSAVYVYTGLVYEGPSLVRDIVLRWDEGVGLLTP